ncbi:MULTISPECIES: FAD-binding oxidoreductase [unclassified Rhizobium]|uniref:NAD(P)/FAD-dependent oxidoreductase n=1 Tax=unclassified Rhizobium TaxID=2613769 RepID=UPI0006FE0E01|nr:MULTISPECIES: FAD-binding oxidoreductase [unclassified Rhizobium]KQV41782.1 FAD-dependent oxidoreductase [Rhizobium sp. Root1212]KRD30009.1 FAD-dependent oxidoreductase [Rhizobium sp. Root268]
MLNDPRSHGLWEKTAPAAPVTRSLDGNVTADVVIVGGGFTGISAALHLAEAGRRAVVLEGAEIGFGGAGRNVGLINAGMWVMPDDLPGELGDVHGERLLDMLGNAPRLVMELIERHGIACELERNGTLHCAVGEAGLKEITERAGQWQRRGAPVTLLDATETAKRIGTAAYAGSLLDMRAGTLQPLAYVRGLAKAAIAAGATIHTASRVTSYARSGSQWTVRTDGGSVTAPWVIVSTDAYSTGPWESVRREQVHLPYFNLATRPLSPRLLSAILPGREGVWDTKEILSSFRMDRAGRLVFGSVGALRNTGRAVHVAWAKRALKRLFPALGPVEFECEWFGKIGMTDNALPRFHRFAENVVGFSGYNGRGIAPGTVFGRTLAQLVLGGIGETDLPLPLTDAKTPALRPVKELYYEAGAQIAHFAGERF